MKTALTLLKYNLITIFEEEATLLLAGFHAGPLIILVELESENVIFIIIIIFWREETRDVRRKTLEAGTRANNTLSPHMTPGMNRNQATLARGG